MTKKRRTASAPLPPIARPEVLDELLGAAPTEEHVEAVFQSLKKAVIERALGAELTHHLGYAKGQAKPSAQPNHRNGSSPKTVLTDAGTLPLAIPRDRHGTFEPQLVPKGLRRLRGFDEKVISLYARGLSVREIRAHLEELYGVEVAPDLISAVTDAVVSEITTWQQRPLERLYVAVVFDALRVKIRDEGVVRNKAVYLALGIRRDGTKDVLGFWIEQTEGAAFWYRVMTELKNRGVEDILIALVDGLVGFPDAITAVFPQAQVQQCVVHLVRKSLGFVGWKERYAVAQALRAIYRADTEAAAATALEEFAASEWGRRFPPIVALWRRHWDYVRPAFVYPREVRRVVYTTNAIESLHRQLRKSIKTRGHFPNDDAATKLLYLALRNILATWQRPAPAWQAAVPHFAVLFAERFGETE